MTLTLLLFIWACGRLLKPHTRRGGWILISGTIAVVLICGWGWVPSYLLGRLQSTPRLAQPQWKSRNVIVLLGGGHVRWTGGEWSSSLFGMSRVRESARLYNGCRTRTTFCKLLVSGGDPKKLGTTEAEVMRDELLELGVKAPDILIENKSRNTFQNAEFSAPLVREQGADQVVLVTSGGHLPRATLFFSHFGIQVEGAPSDFVHVERSMFPSAQNLFYTDLALHETIGVWRYHIYNLLGWNKR
jgi:uncharacterized SAM-binding protein YcdF (DUF218 family)